MTHSLGHKSQLLRWREILQRYCCFASKSKKRNKLIKWRRINKWSFFFYIYINNHVPFQDDCVNWSRWRVSDGPWDTCVRSFIPSSNPKKKEYFYHSTVDGLKRGPSSSEPTYLAHRHTFYFFFSFFFLFFFLPSKLLFLFCFFCLFLSNAPSLKYHFH